ncbi:MAG: DNA repair and recombination protein RadA [Candidatus Aenigmatarchaeota archaeon]
MSDEIDLKDLPGVGEKTAEKLKDEGYKDLMSIAAASSGEISGKTSIGESTAKKIISAARNEMEMGFDTASKVYEEKDDITQISTNSDKIDELIGGGIETQTITEAYGGYGSGKSQMAFQLSVNVQKEEGKGGLGKGCVFIDTENTFSPERVKEIAENHDMDPEEVLDNIYVARAYNSDHQMVLVNEADEILGKQEVGLVVVDSLTGQFRADYTGRGDLAERQQKLNRHLHDLQRLAEVYNVAVFISNQVMSKPDVMFGDPTEAIGGHILHHAAAFRMYLRKGKGDTRICKLVDSPYKPEGEAPFKITEKGIVDK